MSTKYIRRVATPEEKAFRKQLDAEYRRSRPKLTKEEKEYQRSCREYDRECRQREKEERKEKKLNRQNVKRELAVLAFMKKNDVKFYHHGREDSMLKTINNHIEQLKKPNASWQIYDPYIWNYQGEGRNYTSRCLLGNLWSRSEGFETIYDVPLDGSYKFYITDSGSRGLGSYDYIQAAKVDEPVYVPKVNPGGFFGF